jgi:tRNA threonylcarbamoyladenosine biosynthesis protein TsaE
LGAGKTTFSRFLAEACGVTSPVASPTFVLSFEYAAAGGLKIEHWDLYRLRGLPEELHEPPPGDVLRLIEWADRVPELAAGMDLVISINVAPGRIMTSTRTFDFSGRLAELVR